MELKVLTVFRASCAKDGNIQRVIISPQQGSLLKLVWPRLSEPRSGASKSFLLDLAVRAAAASRARIGKENSATTTGLR
jgi:hypothetical protein